MENCLLHVETQISQKVEIRYSRSKPISFPMNITAADGKKREMYLSHGKSLTIAILVFSTKHPSLVRRTVARL